MLPSLLELFPPHQIPLWSGFSFWVVCINNKYRATLNKTNFWESEGVGESGGCTVKVPGYCRWCRTACMEQMQNRFFPNTLFLVIWHSFVLSCWLWFSLITVICVSINSPSYLCVRYPFVSQILITTPCEPSFQESGSLTRGAQGGFWHPASSYLKPCW